MWTALYLEDDAQQARIQRAQAARAPHYMYLLKNL
jgi:hypothetical protein